MTANLDPWADDPTPPLRPSLAYLQTSLTKAQQHHALTIRLLDYLLDLAAGQSPGLTSAVEPAILQAQMTDDYLNKPRNFSFPGEYLWDCCKTVRRDYDVVVAAGLIAMQRRFGNNARISSDGNTAQDEEWRNAVKLYQSVFPERELPAMPRILTAGITLR